MKLPTNTKSKDLKVSINNCDICVQCKNGEVIIKDTLPYKIKAMDSVWSVSEEKLLIHLGKSFFYLLIMLSFPSTLQGNMLMKQLVNRKSAREMVGQTTK